MAERNRQDREHSPISRDHHDVEPSTGDVIGEGVGGITGALAGAGLGSLAGPIGTVIGGIAGAAGGWWTGRSVSEAAAHYSEDEERHYRSHWDSLSDRPADADWDRARTGYALGHIAAENPDYRERGFEDVEPELRYGYRGERERDWDTVRPFARYAYERRGQAGDRMRGRG